MGTKLLSEIIEKAIVGLITICVVFLTKELVRYLKQIRNKSKRQLKDALEITNFDKIFSKTFYDDFFLNNLQSLVFYNLSGISVSGDFMNALISFKNTEVSVFNWLAIKNAMPYLKFKNGRIQIEISKWDIIIFKVQRGLGVFLVFLGIIIFGITIPILKGEDKNKLYALLLFVFFYLVGVLLILSKKEVASALRIKKHLDEVAADSVMTQQLS